MDTSVKHAVIVSSHEFIKYTSQLSNKYILSQSLPNDLFRTMSIPTGYSDASFLAVLQSDTDPTGTIIFTNDAINPGGHYNASTGEYTVPCDGIYEFTAHLQGSFRWC